MPTHNPATVDRLMFIFKIIINLGFALSTLILFFLNSQLQSLMLSFWFNNLMYISIHFSEHVLFYEHIITIISFLISLPLLVLSTMYFNEEINFMIALYSLGSGFLGHTVIMITFRSVLMLAIPIR